nr:putative G3BP-like protein isoform X1 [Ipomoea batatas]
MATPFSLPVTAAQVGSYFLGQYYQVLQQQPEFVYQFYSDASTMIRIDANARETASGMLQIHTVIMSLHFTGIEIKTAHSLESWNGGVLVMVSGSVHVKDFNGRRKFVQTFFLAPQEKGYFIFNDIFHFVEEERIIQHHVAYLSQANIDTKLNTPATFRDQVSNYLLGGEIQARDFVPPAKIEENGPVNDYHFAEEQLQQVSEAEKIPEDNFAVQSNGSLQSTMNHAQDHISATIEEPIAEPQKHTYASIVCIFLMFSALNSKRMVDPVILKLFFFLFGNLLKLQVAKAPSVQAVPLQASNKPAPPSSEWQDVPDPPSQPACVPSNSVERSGAEVVEEYPAVEDES